MVPGLRRDDIEFEALSDDKLTDGAIQELIT